MNLPINEIICGDCLEVMKDWPDNCVDLVLTDPPYKISSKNKVMIINPSTGGVGKAEFGDWDKGKFDYSYIKKTSRLLKETGGFMSFFDAKLSTNIWKKCIKAGLKPKQFIYWFKGYKGLNPRKNFVSSIEVGLWAVKSPKYYWGGGGNTVNLCVETINELNNPRNNYHPTQKTIELALILIRLFSKVNDIIFDPYCGAGAFCIAAKKLGRNYIGIDISEEYCDISRKRIKGIRPNIFDFNKPKKKIRADLGLTIKKGRKKIK